MIYFDRKNLSVLLYIYRRRGKGVSLQTLWDRFGDDRAGIFFIGELLADGYILVSDSSGRFLLPKEEHFLWSGDFRCFCSPKGNEFLERRFFDFWKFTIPLLISILALVVSYFTLRHELQAQEPQQLLPSPPPITSPTCQCGCQRT